MNKLLCVLVLFYVFHNGVTQEETTTIYPEYSSTFDALNSLVSDTKAGSNLMVMIEQFLGSDTNFSPYLETFEESIYKLLDNDTAAEIGKAMAAILQDPEAIKKILNDSREETTDMRQRIMKEILLAGMRALSTEVGQTFMKTVTRMMIKEVLSNSGSIVTNGGNVKSSAYSGSKLTDSSGSILSSELYKILKLYAMGSARSSTESVEKRGGGVKPL